MSSKQGSSVPAPGRSSGPPGGGDRRPALGVGVRKRGQIRGFHDEHQAHREGRQEDDECEGEDKAAPAPGLCRGGIIRSRLVEFTHAWVSGGCGYHFFSHKRMAFSTLSVWNAVFNRAPPGAGCVEEVASRHRPRTAKGGGDAMNGDPHVSIVIPVRDEEGAVEDLAGEITLVMEEQRRPWECVWVDDGSTDGGPELLARIARNDPRHRLIRLPGPAGKSAAMWSGFKAARGTVIANLDGDGQNDPADLPRLVRMVESGSGDYVKGYRAHRMDGPMRRIASRIGNAVRTLITGRTVRDVGCSTCAFHRKCIEDIPRFFRDAPLFSHPRYPERVQRGRGSGGSPTASNGQEQVRYRTEDGARPRGLLRGVVAPET